MAQLIFVTHPEVEIVRDRPVTSWLLSEAGAARAAVFARSPVLRDVARICASGEIKARETAAILASALDLPVKTVTRLGENDRSATGFLEPKAFERAADAFFASPEASFSGWETAREAQVRIVDAISDLAGEHETGDLLVVSHGAIGTLLWCHFSGCPISRQHDQPFQGHYWTAPLPSGPPDHGWKTIG